VYLGEDIKPERKAALKILGNSPPRMREIDDQRKAYSL
jgi:hypothetical protein